MASTLGLYNSALRLCKNRKLSSLTEDTEGRHALDDVYASALSFTLEAAQWQFASRSAPLAGTASSNRGYSYRYEKPSDFVRLISISASSNYWPPLEAYAEDASYFYGNEASLHLVYVSDDAAYGGDLSKWPASYAKVVEAYLALEIAPVIKHELKQELRDLYEERLAFARAKDAINRTVRVVSSATLSAYNGALRLLGKRLLDSSSDEIIARRVFDATGREADQETGEAGAKPSLGSSELEDERTLRRLLDEAYDSCLAATLEAGIWNFAIRSVMLEAETDEEPEFGFSYTFTKPSDWVRTAAISDSETFYPPLGPNTFADETDRWHADVDLLYVSYVSSDAEYGGNTSLWPPSFKHALEAQLALEIAPAARLSAAKIALLEEKLKKRLREARSKDSFNQPTQRLPPGRLVSSRGTSRFDQRRENS